MEKKEVMLYTMTLISLVLAAYIFYGAITKLSNISNNEFKSLTGNVVFDLSDQFKIGDKLVGEIIITQEESTAYGVLLLTKEDKSLITKTFNLNEVPKTKLGSGYSVNLDDLIDYDFEESGRYELFLSILDLDINLKNEFSVSE